MPTTFELTRDFLAASDDIDLRNVDYFMFQPAEANGDRDKLNKHCKFRLQAGKALFGFVHGSCLPNPIRKKCISAFAKFFPDGDVIGNLFNR